MSNNKDDAMVTKGLVGTLAVATIIVIGLALLGRSKTEKQS